MSNNYYIFEGEEALTNANTVITVMTYNNIMKYAMAAQAADLDPVIGHKVDDVFVDYYYYDGEPDELRRASDNQVFNKGQIIDLINDDPTIEVYGGKAGQIVKNKGCSSKYDIAFELENNTGVYGLEEPTDSAIIVGLDTALYTIQARNSAWFPTFDPTN